MSNASPTTKFDFLVLTAHGAAEHAIFRYLDLHPDVFPTFIETSAQAALSSYAEPIKRVWGDKVRTGLVFATAHERPIAAVLNDLVQCTEKRLLIQLVRDPIRLLLSLYNNTMKLRAYERFTDLNVDDFFMKHLPAAFYHAAAQALGASFDHWEIIDTSDITGEKTPGTLARLFGLMKLPVDAALLEHPALKVAQNDLVQSFLRLAPGSTAIFGAPLRFLLQTDGSLDHMGSRTPRAVATEERYEVVAGVVDRIPPEVQEMLKASRLRIMAETHDWLAVHPKIRERIVRENLLGKDAVGAMGKLAERIKSRMNFQRLTVADLDAGLVERVKSAIADDARALFERAPGLRKKWDVCGDV